MDVLPCFYIDHLCSSGHASVRETIDLLDQCHRLLTETQSCKTEKMPYPVQYPVCPKPNTHDRAVFQYLSDILRADASWRKGFLNQVFSANGTASLLRVNQAGICNPHQLNVCTFLATHELVMVFLPESRLKHAIG